MVQIWSIKLTKPELRFCAGSNPACGVLEMRDDEDLWQWSRLEIRLNTFRWSTIPQKQFIIIIIIIIIRRRRRRRLALFIVYRSSSNLPPQIARIHGNKMQFAGFGGDQTLLTFSRCVGERMLFFILCQNI